MAKVKKNDKSEKKAANLSTFMLTQDFQPTNWINWDDDEKLELVDYKRTAKVIADRFAAQGIVLAEAYSTIHDKDENLIFDEYKNQYTIKFTSRHIHFVGKFAKGSELPLEKIAEIAGVEPNFIERPKAGGHSYDNMLSYIIHIKYPEKYQYDPHSVVTLAGKQYIEYFRENHRSWMRGRAARIIRDEAIKLEDLRVLIAEEKITEREVYDKPEYNQVLHDHLKTIEQLFENQRAIKMRRNGEAPEFWIGKE